MNDEHVEELFLSCFLENLVTPEIRQCCSDSDDLFNFVQQDANDVLIYSGSWVEGARNNGDIDLMYCRNDFVIAEAPIQGTTKDVPSVHEKGCLWLDMQGCFPGFTKLLLSQQDENVGDTKTEHMGRNYLHGIKFTQYASKCIHGFTTEEEHGPAIMDHSRNVEYVVCLHSPSWPSIANGFLERLSKCEKIVAERDFILSKGCHVVPISHPLSKSSEIEFRLSFSVVEKYLIRNWTIRQLRCYFLCKELSKAYLNGSHLEKGICSYFIKTAMFWIIEQEPLEFWEQFYLQCIQYILDTLIGYVKNKTCPNYFIPENLMMATFTDAQCEQLLSMMKQIQNQLFLFSLSGETIREYVPDSSMLISICATVYTLDDREILQDVLTNIFQTNKYSFMNLRLCDYQNYASHRLSLLYTFVFALQFGSKFREKPFLKREHSPLFTGFKIYHDRHIAYQMLETSLRMDKVKKTEYQQGNNQSFTDQLPTDQKQQTDQKQTTDQQMPTNQKQLTNKQQPTDQQQSKNKDPRQQGENQRNDGDGKQQHVNDADVLLKEKHRYVNSAETMLLSSVQIPGILDDHGLTGYMYLALFYYVTEKHEKALDMLKEVYLSSKQIQPESMKRADLPIIISGSNARAPAFFHGDEILRGLYEERHLHIVSFDSLVLSTYLRYRMTGDVRFLYVLIQIEKELEFRLWGPKDLQHRDTTWESYFYIRYKLGVLEEESKEFVFLSKKADCSTCKTWNL